MTSSLFRDVERRGVEQYLTTFRDNPSVHVHYIPTYMHACMHTYIHTRTLHTYIYGYIHTYIHTHTYTTYIHKYTHIHIYIHYVPTYTYICTYIHTNIHAYIRTLHTYTYRVFHDLRTLLQEVISLVFVIKKVHINMCPNLDGQGVTTA